MSSEIYQQARYYEIAFGFVNAEVAVDRFEASAREHGRIEVQTLSQDNTSYCGSGDR